MVKNRIWRPFELNVYSTTIMATKPQSLCNLVTY